ncbi:hypothetical protein Rhe02_02960 [Rhizocola hellebori]|uniref:Uncharacterized protein n=2 Tax=Rhizocola hellebori TaxID=1392758 RepID=A0A8J3VC47_9ACTN|nr:hypothetical protein Rhe02_02960 [Rhizocola hellebori]
MTGSGALLAEGELDLFDIDLRVSALHTVHAEEPGPQPTQGEFTCEPACDISGVKECNPSPGTDDCCEGGASIIPISDGAFTCDCPDTATCPK